MLFYKQEITNKRKISGDKKSVRTNEGKKLHDNCVAIINKAANEIVGPYIKVVALF